MQGHDQIGPQRYRESFGRYYDDFTVGDVYEHRPGRTITESDNTWFTLITMNTHPLHFDKEYAAKSEFKRPLVNSCLTLSMVVGMSVSDISQKAIGNLGWNDIKLTAPVFVGDTIYAESEVLAKRESASRPGQGLVTVRTIGKKADGTQFMSFERTAGTHGRTGRAYTHDCAGRADGHADACDTVRAAADTTAFTEPGGHPRRSRRHRQRHPQRDANACPAGCCAAGRGSRARHLTTFYRRCRSRKLVE